MLLNFCDRLVLGFVFLAKPCLKCRRVPVFKPQLSQPENLAILQEAVTRALIDSEKNVILELQCLGLNPWSVVALGTITVELRVLKRELYGGTAPKFCMFHRGSGKEISLVVLDLVLIRRTEVVFYSCLLPSSFTSSISELRNCWDYAFGCVLLSTTVLPSSY